MGITSASPLEYITNATSWLLRTLVAEISYDRERAHTRIGSIGISVKKNNVLPALSPGLLHGLYKDWDELIENKETRGGRNGWAVGKQQRCRNTWLLLVPDIMCSFFLQSSSMHETMWHKHYRHLTLCKTELKQMIPNAEVMLRVPKTHSQF